MHTAAVQRDNAGYSSRMLYSTLLVVFMLIVSACAGAGTQPADVIVDSSGCRGEGAVADGGIYGQAPMLEGYQAVDGEQVWTILSGPDQPMYIATIRPESIENMKEALTRETGTVFVEVERCGGDAWMSTTIDATQGVLGLIAGDGETLLIVASRPDGQGGGVRRGLETMLSGWVYPPITG